MRFTLPLLSLLLASAASSRLNEEKAKIVRRKLENQIEIGADQTIKFNSCISLTTQLDEDTEEAIGYSNELSELRSEGKIVGQESYILFEVCDTEDESCFKGKNNDDSNMYVVDLASYMTMAAYEPQRKADYCEGCVEAQEWCAYYGQVDGDGRRNLKNQEIEYVDCGVCEEMGCWSVYAEEDQEMQENILGWVEEQAQCVQTGVQWDANTEVYLYTGFICNEAGSGVEPAVFLDEACTVYTSERSYTEVTAADADNNNYPYAAENAQDIVTFPFVNDIDCDQEPQYDSPENEAENNQNNDDGNNDQEPEANQFCQALSGYLTPLSYCNYLGGNNENQDEAEQAEYVYGAEPSYDLSAEEVGNPYYACEALHKVHEGSNKSWKSFAVKKNAYEAGEVGSMYDYGDGFEWTAGKIAGLVIGILVLVALLAFIIYKCYSNRRDKDREGNYRDTKKEPLMKRLGNKFRRNKNKKNKHNHSSSVSESSSPPNSDYGQF